MIRIPTKIVLKLDMAVELFGVCDRHSGLHPDKGAGAETIL
jgi:hypothetical protein